MKPKHFIWKKKKASLPLVTETKERLEDSVDQATRAEREKYCPVTYLETWWVGMNEQQQTCLLPQGLSKNMGNCVIC